MASPPGPRPTTRNKDIRDVKGHRMTTARPRPRRPRADAQRNYDRLLAEADAAFREHGTDASLQDIARRAEVAVGTLYGHFPNRLALAAALLRDRNVVLFAYGERLPSEEPSAATALAAWTRACVRHAAAYQGLATMLAEGFGDEASELHAACEQLAAISERLLADARATGAVGPEVTSADLFTLVGAAAWARTSVPEEQAEKLLEIALRGLLDRG
jgi:AcrR family transcriptional regulator